MPPRPSPRPARPLPARLAAHLLPALLLAAPVAAQPAPSAADLLARTAAAHRALGTYHVEAAVTVEMTADGMSQGMDYTVEFARRGPDVLRAAMRSDVLHLVAVGRGDSLLLYGPDAGLYAYRPGPVRPDDPDLPIPDPVASYEGIAEDVDAARVTGTETVNVGGAAREAWVVDVDYGAHASAPEAADSLRKTLWIDREHHLVLRDVTRSRTADSPFGGPAVLRQDTRFMRLQPNGPLPDSLFALAPPAGAEEVTPETLFSRFMLGPSLVGEERALDFTLPTLDGASVTLSELRGRTVLINFWATWCGPCRAEMPVLEALHREHAEDGLVVLAVNLGDAPEAVRAYVDRYGFTFPVLLDEPGTTGNAYGAMSIPVSVLVDAEGTVTTRFEGAQTEEAFRAALLEVGVE